MSKLSRLVVKTALRVVKVDLIQFDKSYQREVRPKHKKIATEFNQEAFGILVVGEREDGTLWCVDGLQRLTAARLLGKKEVRVEVFASSGPEHEARIFGLINTNRTKLRAKETFQASLTEGDEASWDIKKIVEEAGFKLSLSSNNNSGVKLTCINTLKRIYTRSGAVALKFVMLMIKQLWEDDPLRTKSDLFEGLWVWYKRKDGLVDVERLIERLKRTTASKLIFSSSLGVGDRGSNVSDVIDKLYNKRK